MGLEVERLTVEVHGRVDEIEMLRMQVQLKYRQYDMIKVDTISILSFDILDPFRNRKIYRLNEIVRYRYISYL